MNPATLRLIGVAAAASLLFGLGWKVNGWRLEAKYAATQEAVFAAYEERRRILAEQAAAQREADEQARADLSAELEETSARVQRLLVESRTAQMSADEREIRAREEALLSCERSSTDENTIIRTVAANPLSADFVRLWNESARGAGPEAGPAPATD